jgi:hypothetical protein
MGLADRLSVALAAEPPDACPGDLALAAETVVVDWMRETARSLKHSDDIAAAVLLTYAEKIESDDLP